MSSTNQNRIFSKGRIAVYSDKHELKNDRIYYTAGGMKKIMDMWFEAYPDGFYIQVRPYIKDQKKQTIRLDIVKETPIKRPEAKYNNIPAYNYEEKKNGKH